MKKQFILLLMYCLFAPGLQAQYMAGNGTEANGWCCGLYWSTDGCPMTAVEEGTSYSYTITLPAGSYEFKVVDNGNWYGTENLNTDASSSMVSGSDNIVITLTAESVVTVMYYTSGNSIVVTTQEVIKRWTLAGNCPFFGETAWEFYTSNDLTQSTDNENIWTKTYTNVTITDEQAGQSYSYKAGANGGFIVAEYPQGTDLTFTAPSTAGTYNITFTLNTSEWSLTPVATEATTPVAPTADLFNVSAFTTDFNAKEHSVTLTWTVSLASYAAAADFTGGEFQVWTTVGTGERSIAAPNTALADGNVTVTRTISSVVVGTDVAYELLFACGGSTKYAASSVTLASGTYTPTLPTLYLVGVMNNWALADETYKGTTTDGITYTWSWAEGLALTGRFKINDGSWTGDYNIGLETSQVISSLGDGTLQLVNRSNALDISIASGYVLNVTGMILNTQTLKLTITGTIEEEVVPEVAIYIRGTLNNWLNDYITEGTDIPAEWKGVYDETNQVYVWDWSAAPKIVTNEFKFGDAAWGTYNYGAASETDQVVELGVKKKLSSASSFNFNVPSDATWTISKITLDLNNLTVLFEGESAEKVYSADTDYGVKVRYDMEYSSVTNVYDMTFQGSGVYKLENLEITSALWGRSFKIADASWGDINFGYAGGALQDGVSADLISKDALGAYMLMLPGSVVNITVTITGFDAATIQVDLVSGPSRELYLLGESVNTSTGAAAYKCTVAAGGAEYVAYTWTFGEPIALSGDIYFANAAGDFALRQGTVFADNAGTFYCDNLSFGTEKSFISTLGAYSVSKIEIVEYAGGFALYVTVSEVTTAHYKDLYLVLSDAKWPLADSYKATPAEGVYTWTFDTPLSLSGTLSFADAQNYTTAYGATTGTVLSSSNKQISVNTFSAGATDIVVDGTVSAKKVVLDAVKKTLAVSDGSESTVGLSQAAADGLAAYAQDGLIRVNAAEFRIYDLAGRDVTAANGSLRGLYIVRANGQALKVLVK